MHLRDLQLKDAPLMLEWMHDKDVAQHLSANFGAKELDDCNSFILNSHCDKSNVHKAIVSDEDEYMGTVSLKSVDFESGNAEFAITVRKAAMGKGYSWYGMVEIFNYAFNELGLSTVYWCVSQHNTRACRFYDKHGFDRLYDISDKILSRYEGHECLNWYCVSAGDNYENVCLTKGEVAGCPIKCIKTIPNEGAGQLSFFEAGHDIPFEVKRIYYISKVPEGVRRGFHAHKQLKQLLFCPYGKIQLILDNGKQREEITLSDPSVGVVIDKPVWREMLWLQKDSVLCVAASEYYDVDDYIRDYKEFAHYVDKEEHR